MFYSPTSNKADSSFVGLIDTAAKAVAVVVAMSLLVGTTFNIAFFFSTKPDWLFHVSVADNVNATFVAIPVATLAILAFVGVHSFVRWAWRDRDAGGAARGSPISLRGISIVLLPFAILMGAYFTFASGWRLGLTAGAFAVIYGGLMIAGLYVGLLGWPLERLLVVYGAMCLVAIVVTAAASGVESGLNQKRAKVEVEVVDTLKTRSILSGTIVRHLEGGLILEQPRSWIWIPKEQIRRITEFDDAKP